ncbi:MAG: NTP transferase domain-containing protein [Persicimonas sp.]
MTEQTSHAIILAAGFGSRLSPDEGHKILVEIAGKPLLDYHLEQFAALGVSDVTVVTGYRNEALEATLASHALPPGVTLHSAHNPDFETSNGISVLAGVDAAVAKLGGDAALPFWLTMSDHVFDPALAARLEGDFVPRLDDRSFEGMLVVDKKLDTIFDMPDANKIALSDGELAAIGKELEAFDRVDAGLFWCAKGFVEALRAERRARGDCSTSDAVRRLAADGAFLFWDIGPHLWQDVDTPEARAHAEKLARDW